MKINRRHALLTALFGTGHVGLRALATGLPTWFLLDPEAASADGLKAYAAGQATAQFLIVSASSAGDALACNAPGTYDPGKAIVHPAEFPAPPVTLGSTTVNGAPNWQTDLTAATRARTAFFHHITGGLVHGDHPKVMTLLGQTNVTAARRRDLPRAHRRQQARVREGDDKAEMGGAGWGVARERARGERVLGGQGI